MEKIIHIPANTEAFFEFNNPFLGIKPRLLFSLGHDAKATVIEYHLPFDADNGGETIMIDAREGSHIDYMICSRNVGLYDGSYTANLGRNSQCNWHFFGELNNSHQCVFTINHHKEGSLGDIIIALKGQGGSRNMIKLFNNHMAARTSGNIWFRSLGGETSLTDIFGLIRMGQKASGTRSYFHGNSLLLSEKSSIRVEPHLEILNSEVGCSHSAAIGGLDQDALHYMESRGLPPDQAKALLIKSFLRALLPNIKNQKIRKIFAEVIIQSS